MPSAGVAVIGGGIAGLAHAYHAARSGQSVVLFERDAAAQGASVRNFGMVWPIGQPPGERLALALASREHWLEMLTSANLPISGRGSLHLAYHRDEADVLAEFAERSPGLGYQCRWLGPAATLDLSPGARREGLLGSLHSTTEVIVDPRAVVRRLPRMLAEQFSVSLQFGTTVHSVSLPCVETSQGTWQVERAIVCGGHDFRSLYPQVFAHSGLVPCKLQMMRTSPQPGAWRMGPAVAAGLSLRFYSSFAVCESLGPLRSRIALELPEYDRYGIHVMASQMPDGSVTLGDSHEYGDAVSIFDKPEIDALILDYLRGFLHLPDPAISERWHGVYAKHPSLAFFEASPASGVRIVTGLGGAGMTLSFGVAERTWRAF